MSESVKKAPKRPTPPPSPVEKALKEESKIEQAEIQPSVTQEVEPLQQEVEQQEQSKEQAQPKEKNASNSTKQNKKSTRAEKAKQKTPKKQTAPKQKKEREKIHIGKVGIILIVVGALVVALGATGLGFYLKHINTKLETPTFQVYQRQTGTIIQISEVKNAYGYEVSVLQGGAMGGTFKITDNVIELKSYLNAPGVFTLKVRALGKTDNATSDYSDEQTLTNIIQLDAPRVYRDENVLSWNPISHASGYRVYYRANISSGEVDYVELSQELSTLTFDLTSLNVNGPALYPVCVQAIAPSEGYYVNSNYSDSFKYEYYAQSQTPFNATYNNDTKLLKFSVYANTYYSNKYSVAFTLQNSFNLVKHEIFADDATKMTSVYLGKQVIEFTVDFTEIVNENVINATITTLADNEYALGCGAVEITVD